MKRAAICLSALWFSGKLMASDPLVVEFYDVQGNDLREMRKWMEDHGPAGDDGVRYHGYTKWSVGWSFRFAPNGQACEIQSIETKLEATMTLPRWNKPDRASKRIEQEWERYIAALRQHEDGHYGIAVSAAEEIKRRLFGLTKESGCQAFADDINDKAKAVIAEFRAKESAYDAATDHGVTQGAQL